jgi:hypothetical protein
MLPWVAVSQQGDSSTEIYCAMKEKGLWIFKMDIKFLWYVFIQVFFILVIFIICLLLHVYYKMVCSEVNYMHVGWLVGFCVLIHEFYVLEYVLLHRGL